LVYNQLLLSVYVDGSIGPFTQVIVYEGGRCCDRTQQKIIVLKKCLPAQAHLFPLIVQRPPVAMAYRDTSIKIGSVARVIRISCRSALTVKFKFLIAIAGAGGRPKQQQIDLLVSTPVKPRIGCMVDLYTGFFQGCDRLQ
jgi:hypothetical protein